MSALITGWQNLTTVAAIAKSKADESGFSAKLASASQAMKQKAEEYKLSEKANKAGEYIKESSQ